MYSGSPQGIGEHIINVCYCYYYYCTLQERAPITTWHFSNWHLLFLLSLPLTTAPHDSSSLIYSKNLSSGATVRKSINFISTYWEDNTALQLYPHFNVTCLFNRSWDSLLARVQDSLSKGCEFKSRLGQQENFLIPSQLCVLTVIQCPFHPQVTTVAHKWLWSFCQKCTWQVTPKHAYTLG